MPSPPTNKRLVWSFIKSEIDFIADVKLLLAQYLTTSTGIESSLCEECEEGKRKGQDGLKNLPFQYIRGNNSTISPDGGMRSCSGGLNPRGDVYSQSTSRYFKKLKQEERVALRLRQSLPNRWEPR